METSLISIVVELAKNAGPYAIVIILLVWLFWRSDKERRELSAKLLDLAQAANSTAQAWAEILEKSKSRRQ